ncbi:MAG: PEP-CTERM sorting domain-containing protein [Planctomycetaceae bacterium]|nr:PEP-CTERM sorting domain-containing protein [Planctomycetaceae bacterium]
MKWMALLVSGLMFASELSTLSAGLVTIHDRTFSNGTWAASVLGGTNVSSVSLSRLIGQGVTGDALRTTINGSGAFTFDVQQFKQDRPFVTVDDGVIESIGWEIWYKVENSSQFASWRLAARQAGTTYVANSTYFEPQLFSANWQRRHGTIAPNAFSRVSGPGSVTLDTSVGGAPIEFGYILSRGVFLTGNTSYRASFFTLDIQTTAVPEPSSLVFIGTTLAMAISIRRRSR